MWMPFLFISPYCFPFYSNTLFKDKEKRIITLPKKKKKEYIYIHEKKMGRG
jgi:hypothetical protein